MPGVHRVVSLLKRWLMGTHQGFRCSGPPSVLPGGVHVQIQQTYLNSRGLVFRRLIEQAVITGPVTEADVTFGYDWSQSQARRSYRLPPCRNR